MMPNNKKLVGKRVDITPLFQKAGIATGKLEIIETQGMYPYKEKIEDNWAYFTAVGIKKFKEMLDRENKKVYKIGIVGICSGVEGIAVVQIFKDTLRELIVTDIDDEILQGTVINISHASQNTNVTVLPVMGSFCEPIERAGAMVDFVHANIPNLPAHGDEDLTKGAEKGTFLPEQLYDVYNPPNEFVGWALAAQYAYLQSAKKIIPSGGSVITELGGRVPMPIVQKLFAACDLHLEEIIVSFKEQTEALIDFKGYHALEEQYGTAFEFYRYIESKKILAEHDLSEPTSTVSATEIKSLLEPYKVTAGEALNLYQQNIPVGHTVHLFRGIKN